MIFNRFKKLLVYSAALYFLRKNTHYTRVYTVLKNDINFRRLTLVYFRKGRNADQTAKNECTVYGEGALAESTVCKWFNKFRSRNIDLEADL